MLLAEARYPSGSPDHSRVVSAACAVGSVSDLASLRSFLHGRLWTLGAISAAAAAAVCARAGEASAPAALLRTVEAELDARLASPAVRRESRDRGGHVLSLAANCSRHPHLTTLARASAGHSGRPHYPVVIGVIAALAGCVPFDAAEAAAYESITGPAFAAGSLLGLAGSTVSELGIDLAPEVTRLARAAADWSDRPFSDLPAPGAPALFYLSEEQPLRPDLARR